jgi:hypothetical protein
MRSLMTELDIILKLIMAGIAGWCGIQEYRMRKMSDKIDNVYSKDETKEIIDMKQEAIREKIDNIKEGQEEIKHDLSDIRDNISKLANK